MIVKVFVLSVLAGLSVAQDNSTGYRNETYHQGNSTGGWNVTPASNSTTGQSSNSSTLFTSCGGHLTGSSGVIRSPNYPRKYPNSAHCVWTITTDPGWQIRLTFNSFDVEGCPYDMLDIYDGVRNLPLRLQRLCGRRSVRPLTSSSNALYLEFTSDASVTRKGFSARWTKVNSTTAQNETDSHENSTSQSSSTVRPHNSSSHWNQTSYQGNYTSGWNVTPANSNVTSWLTNSSSGMGNSTTGQSSNSSTLFTTCGEDFTGRYGSLQSPNYPSHYPNQAKCVWTITTDPGWRVRLVFSDFQLENCPYDTLVILDGINNSSQRIARFCGIAFYSVTSSSNVMYLEFNSDTSITQRGFRLQWITVDNSPAQNATHFQGNSTIQSSSTDSPYSNVTSWLTNSSGIVYNNTSGWRNPLPFTACGEDQRGKYGTLQSPNYPSNYPNLTRCVWTITTDPGLQIRLVFEAFNLENERNCRYDSLAIYDGNTLTSSRKSLCGRRLPASVTSSGHVMLLEFKSDSSVTFTGFKAYWFAENNTSTQDSTLENNATSSNSAYGNNTALWTNSSGNSTASWNTSRGNNTIFWNSSLGNNTDPRNNSPGNDTASWNSTLAYNSTVG